MEIANTLINQLHKHGVNYDTISHSYSNSSLHTAHAANIPVEKMVKSVVLEDAQGFIMALVPANHYLKINEVNLLFDRRMSLATESKLDHLFTDCDHGAIPPIGSAYGISTVIDNNLENCDDVYIEAGNHTEVLHLSGCEFRNLLEHAHHGDICLH